MNERGQMVRAIKLGQTGWALLGAQLQIIPAPDDPAMMVVGIVLVGARDNALVNNTAVPCFVHELFRCRPEDVAGALAQVEGQGRPTLTG